MLRRFNAETGVEVAKRAPRVGWIEGRSFDSVGFSDK